MRELLSLSRRNHFVRFRSLGLSLAPRLILGFFRRTLLTVSTGRYNYRQTNESEYHGLPTFLIFMTDVLLRNG